MKPLVSAIALFLLMLGSLHAGDQPRQQAEAFLDAVIKGNIDQGYDDLFKGSFIVQTKTQQIDYLKSQTKAGLPLYGSLLGFDFVTEVPFGSSVKRLVYILKTENHPLVWDFYFYCPKDTWFLSTVTFNDQFKGLE
jgi:hypothetical protein